ncbi:MAG: glyceraldehyde 3-phosphate dehydrogenase NAD-binding domain-containing protein [bacterium]|nr:glyceraldehyde 3-phosphate dehydrogenase NAD-binding domain-containing protein [bacterium]
MRIAINGFGRIGRLFFRQVFQKPDIEIVAINDLGIKDNLIYLLKHDSVYGKFDISGKDLEKLIFLQEKDPAKLPWRDLNIDVVVESTGVFDSFERAKPHIEAGAKRVVITAPTSKDDEQTVTFTPNVGVASAVSSKITSNASCTTNATVPVAAVMAENPGIVKAILNTVHGYTATQGLVDMPSKSDFRRGRAAGINIVPSSTGASKAVEKIIPSLKGKFGGLSLRVPVVSGSMIDFTFVSKRKTTIDEINNILKEASLKPEWAGVLKVTEEPLVSSDILKEPYGSIVDLEFTRVIDGDLVKVLSWYDNEWGYCAMLIKHIECLKEYI